MRLNPLRARMGCNLQAEFNGVTDHLDLSQSSPGEDGLQPPSLRLRNLDH